MEKQKKVRIQFDFKPDAYKRLEELRQRSGEATKAGVVRLALALYDNAVNCVQMGGTVIFKDDRGKETEVVILPRF